MTVMIPNCYHHGVKLILQTILTAVDDNDETGILVKTSSLSISEITDFQFLVTMLYFLLQLVVIKRVKCPCLDCIGDI